MNNLTEEEMFIYKWQYGMLGSFMNSLIRAIATADKGNLYRLSLGFPMEVSAYKKFSGIEGWWQEVEKKVATWKEQQNHDHEPIGGQP